MLFDPLSDCRVGVTTLAEMVCVVLFIDILKPRDSPATLGVAVDSVPEDSYDAEGTKSFPNTGGTGPEIVGVHPARPLADTDTPEVEEYIPKG